MKQASQTLLTMLGMAALAGCAAGAGYTPHAPAAFDANGSPSRSKGVPVVIQITIPRTTIKAKYVSPATESIVIKVMPKRAPAKTFAANLTKQQCKHSKAGLLCSLKFELEPGKYRSSVSTYDGPLDANHDPTGHELSANQHLPLNVGIHGLTLGIDVSLDGVPASVAFVPAVDSTLSGNATVGYILPKCSTGQTVSVFGTDADGNLMLGPGAPEVTLSSDDSAQLVVTRRSPATPNDFSLSPPAPSAYPFGHLTVHLTATAKPLRDGGGATRTRIVNVTYTGDICGTITEFAVPDSNSKLAGIVAGPDGALWFAESAADKIGRITTNGTITTVTVPTTSSGPQDITSGPDGALWFTEFYGNNIGRISTSGTISEMTVPTPASNPYGITTGPDGAIWFTEHAALNIGRVHGGLITESHVLASMGAELVPGTDHSLWGTDSSGQIFQYVVGYGATIQFAPPYSPSQPSGIAFSPNGTPYYTDIDASVIGCVMPSGAIVSFHTPTIVSEPFEITRGPDGAMWFTEYAGNRIGRITSDQTITETLVPTAGSVPYDITLGPDGALWFTENVGNKIGRLR